MALDFGILQPANISGQIQAGQESAMRNQLAQQQLATGQMQQEKAGLELQQFKRRQAALDQFLVQAEKGGQTGDPEEVAQNFYKFAVTSGEPQVVMAAQQALMAAKERKAYMTSRTPGAPAAAPAMPVAPGALGSGTFDLNAPRPAPAANMLAPAPAPAAAAPANALAMPDTKALENEIFRLETQFPNVPAAQKEAAMLKERLKELYTPRVVGAGGSVIVGGRPIYTAPPTKSEFEKLLADSNLSETKKAELRAQRAQKEASHAPATTVNVSTEKAYGGAFGGKLADVDINKLTTAEKAPQLAESANRIIGLVNQGNVFTGPAAEVKMNIARALNIAGASNDEKIANTEALIAATGQSTLDAIKGAGLGTGQGFTNKDLTFLQGIAGGTIGLTAKTLTDLATLQHRVAVRSADAWNKRASEIPKEVVQGTGLSTTPIKVPALSPATPTPIYAVNPTTGARIQSTDGGNTWKPAGAK